MLLKPGQVLDGQFTRHFPEYKLTPAQLWILQFLVCILLVLLRFWGLLTL
jgi:hypothetical protein